MKTKLNSTRNDLSEKVRLKMVGVLNQVLAEVLDLGFQAKQAHWNVKGPHFIGLHELFDKVAEELEGHSDEIAERAVALGGTALGTVQVVSTQTTLKPYPLDLTSGKGHLEALSAATAALGTSVRAAIDVADEAGDADTADLFTGVSRSVDKLLWLLEAHLQSKD